jgi:tRNA-dihydrouridine synthase
MGCPDRHVNKAGGGAAMIRTPELAVECIKEAKANTNLPVSVKTRLGFTYLDERNDWLKLLLEQDLANLTVHLRTRKEMSKVAAHYELIPEILELRDTIAPNTKITINGDIKDLKHIHELQAQYLGVDGWMIGRGVFQNPYCFTDHNPTTEELLDLLHYHLDLFDARAKELEEKGSRYPYEPMKHFFKVYISSFPGASDLRTKLMDCKSTDEVRQVLKESV